MNDAPTRGDRSTSWLGRAWLDLKPRRGTLFLINIGVPILIGMARVEGRGALIGLAVRRHLVCGRCGLPAIETLDYVYWGIAVLISLASRSADHFINGPLHFAGPWFGAGSFDRWGWVRFSLAYALAATIGLWIGTESASIRAVWISAITLVLMVPDVRVTYIAVSLAG